MPGGLFWIGAIFGGAVAASVMAFAFGFPCLVGVLKDWQTLIAGVLALVGAALTVAWIQRQIDQAQQLEDVRRERRHYAARSAMPAALAEFSDYATQQLEMLHAFGPPVDGTITFTQAWDRKIPAVPPSAVAAFQTCIESAGLRVRKEMAKVLEELQVMNSRLRELPNKTGIGASYLNELVADALEMYVRCDGMFDYARGRASEMDIQITAEQMKTRARFSEFREQDYPTLHELLQRRYGGA